MKKKKRMKKQNVIGAAVMAGLILLSIPMGAGKSLSRLQEEATEQYYYDNAGYAIWEGLEKRQEAAQNLLTVAKRYVDKNPDLVAPVDELEFRLQIMDNLYDDTLTETAAANDEIGVAAEALVGALEDVKLSERDAKYPAQLLAQMQSEQDKIDRSSYNDAAWEFNHTLGRFPTKILASIAGVEPLGIF